MTQRFDDVAQALLPAASILMSTLGAGPKRVEKSLDPAGKIAQYHIVFPRRTTALIVGRTARSAAAPMVGPSEHAAS